jgi:leader peptidase (prepilin peptidase)/N-methyltransferase
MSSPLWLLAAAVAGATTAGLLITLTRRLIAAQPSGSARISTALTVPMVGATAVLFAALAWRTPSVGTLLAAWCLAGVAAPLAVLDLTLRRLPDLLVGPAYLTATAVLTATAIYSGHWAGLLRALACSATVGAGMLILALALPGQLGLGDVKLAAFTALVTGAFSVAAAILATVGAFVAAALLVVALRLIGRTTSGRSWPFGPFLLAAALAALLAAPR